MMSSSASFPSCSAAASSGAPTRARPCAKISACRARKIASSDRVRSGFYQYALHRPCGEAARIGQRPIAGVSAFRAAVEQSAGLELRIDLGKAADLGARDAAQNVLRSDLARALEAGSADQ